MFCAEGRQRDGEAQVAQGCDLVEATSLGHIVFRGQQANHEQRQDGGGHREGGAREFQECGEKSWLHGCPDRYSASNSTTGLVSRPHFSRQPRASPWEQNTLQATILAVLSATLSATWKAAENDCLERRNSIRPCVPSHVAYKAERGGNELFWSPWKKCIHARKSGTETARQRCICQH